MRKFLTSSFLLSVVLFGQSIDYNTQIKNRPLINITQYKVKGDGTTDNTTFITNALTANPNTILYFPPSTSCYKFTTITMQAQTGIQGYGHQTCLQSTGSGNVIYGHNVSGLYFGHFGIKTTTATNGIYLNGNSGLNVTNSIIEDVDFSQANTSVYSNAELLMESTFLISVRNCDFKSGANYGIKLGIAGSGFNNTNIISGNNIAFKDIAGIWLGSNNTNINIHSNVIESNTRKGIWFTDDVALNNIHVTDNHFENNSTGTADYDIFFSAHTGYDYIAGPISINSNNWINSNNQSIAFIYAKDVKYLEVTGNWTTAPFSGATTTNNRIILGRAVIEPRIFGNYGFDVVGESGVPINFDSAYQIFENGIISSVDLSGGNWSLNTGVTVDQSGSPTFTDGSLAWNINLPALTDYTNPKGVGTFWTTSSTGRFFTCRAFVKTDTGTGVGYVSLNNAFGGYTGSNTNQPDRTYIDTSWKEIRTSTSTSASDATGSISCGFKFYPHTGSATSVISIAKPQMCVDTQNCIYISTTTLPIVKSNSPIGHTLFAQLGTASKAKGPVICDDCTVANPAAGSGSGSFVVPISTVWVGK